ncbi:MAG TPA: tRNA uridine-5-carboxymethylaminomethyl(34) synthesis GTPase MnmE [Gammaproteobacteria bacterium]|nr:tRNA uridine-5-carboxymethylaminomethyl(34) synthesis GTPase MnmE [Gammaproteobacteria bacterium]
MPAATETIAAIATPPGFGGVGIVRISGPGVPDLARALLGQLPSPRHAHYARFRGDDGVALDEGLALYFPAPNSFTGEHVLELQGHGGPVVLDLVLARALALGARLARPGEFSERAFLNGKLDLAQAEAVADIIASGSAAAARAAMASLQGDFSRQVEVLTEQVITLRVHIEAAIDFPEEEVDFLADAELFRQLDALRASVANLRVNAGQGRVLRDGYTIVIAGPPNAGKSSLLNALSGEETAIVSAQAGTTRDVLRTHIAIDGLPLHVIDTAGLHASGDAVEQEGIRRARAAVNSADRVLLMLDHSTQPQAALPQPADLLGMHDLPPDLKVTVLYNKIDLTQAAPGLWDVPGEAPYLGLSVATGEGLDALRDHLKACAGYSAGSGVFSARRRHLDALDHAAAHLEAADARLRQERAGELAAEELRLVQAALGEITGAFTSDDLLGRIFSSFCIGK